MGINANDADEQQLAQVLDTALQLCIAQGNAMVEQIIAASRFDAATVIDALATLARRGNLIARPGGSFAQPLQRHVRLPGASYPIAFRAPVAAMMGGR